jgi:hypothetical protein
MVASALLTMLVVTPVLSTVTMLTPVPRLRVTAEVSA